MKQKKDTNKDLFPDYANEEWNITTFFLKLLATKPPKGKDVSNKDQIIFGIKRISAVVFFNLSNLYYPFMSRLTGYYPFSLLYKDRLFHHDNLRVKKFMIKLENQIKKEGVYIYIITGQQEEDMSVLFGSLDPRIKNRENVVRKIESCLQNIYGTVYIRDEGDKVRILFPTELFERCLTA